MFELHHWQIQGSWERIHKGIDMAPQEGTLILGMYYRIFVQEIPNDKCYRFLNMKGHRCNHTGEILLSFEENEEYTSFQQMLLEEK